MFNLFKKKEDRYEGCVSGYYKLIGPRLYENMITSREIIALRDKDKRDLENLEVLITQWCVTQGLLMYSNGEVHWINDDHILNIKHKVHGFSIMSVITEDGLKDYNAINIDTENHSFRTQLIYLKVKLLATINIDVLERYVNRIYHALELVTPPEFRNHWPEVHLNLPEFWVLCLVKYQLDKFAPSVKKMY